MKILISSVGSRGDVQPMVALALELRRLGHDTLLCVPPNFQLWVESYGLTCIPIGGDMQSFIASVQADFGGGSVRKTQALVRFIRGEIKEQFRVLADVAQGCDAIVGGSLQLAGASIAELYKIPYRYAAYCPVILPTHELPPGDNYSFSLPHWINRLLWAFTEQAINIGWRSAINTQRSALQLAPIKNVWRNLLGDQPLLAADAVLGPAAQTPGMQVSQTGAWFLPDATQLPEQVEQFLAAGEPPIYFGFGSMPSVAPQETSRMLVNAARHLGRRAIVSQGWAKLAMIDDRDDCISIGSVSHEQLFPRVAAIVHHGGAGTTSAAARAGKPQVIVPHITDQYYWAHRIMQLGIGAKGPDAAKATTARLETALRDCLHHDVATRAQALANRIDLNGARIAAEKVAMSIL